MEYDEKQQGQPPPYPPAGQYAQQAQAPYPPASQYPQQAQPPYPAGQYAQQAQPGYNQAGYTSPTAVVITQPQTLTVVQGGEVMPSNVGAIVFSCLVTWCCCCILGIIAFVFAGKLKPNIHWLV